MTALAEFLSVVLGARPSAVLFIQFVPALHWHPSTSLWHSVLALLWFPSHWFQTNSLIYLDSFVVHCYLPLCTPCGCSSSRLMSLPCTCRTLSREAGAWGARVSEDNPWSWSADFSAYMPKLHTFLNILCSRNEELLSWAERVVYTKVRKRAIIYVPCMGNIHKSVIMSF